jgi:hypothetical protein
VVEGRPVLATGGNDDGTVRLWDPVEGVALGEPLTGHTGRVLWGAWGVVDGQPVLATGGDDAVRLWEVIEDRPVPRLPSYRSDATAATDALDRTGDAVALAELVTARTARPPLAVGLFGDWGEGKSHFLGLLRQQVQATARPDNLLAHSAVRQVWFNAWHYAETDLWASLVAELFAQLAAPPGGDLGAEQRRQSRLAGELVAERGLRERLQAARARRDQLQQALSEPVGPWELTPEQKAQLGQLVGGHPARAYRKATRTVAALRETGRQWWRLVRGVPLATVAWFLGLIAGLLGVAAGIAWALPAVSRWVLAVPGIASVLAVAGLVGRFVGAARARASEVWKVAQRFGEEQRQRLQTAAAVAAAEVVGLERQMQDLTAAGQLAGLVADRVAGASYRSRLGVMTQIREDFKHMAALLADAAADPQPSPAARSAKAGLETDPEGDGRVGRSARRDGSSGRTAEVDAAGDELPRIDRIILYIDDLDRCPPRRVVELLEAVHLLLAVDLFVVVVAVDPRWLLRSIAAHYRDLFDATTPPEAEGNAVGGDLVGAPGEVPGAPVGMVDPDDEELWRSTPAQYLEKIFQVVLTLPPLETAGYQQLLRTLVGTREDQPTPPPDHPRTPRPADAAMTSTASTTSTAAPAAGPDPATTSHETSPNGGTGGANGRDQQPTEQAEQAELFGVELPAARVVERVDPLTLEPDELALLDLLGPPLLVLTPRGVKRLANSYGLLTALRRQHRDADLAEQHAPILDPATGNLHQVAYRPYRAGMVLLAALVAYPALGPALFGHLHHTAAADPHQPWAQFLEPLQPRQTQGRWANPADPQMTPVQAQQWHALLDALCYVAQVAAEHDLPLPEPLAAWAQWVVPVGRLSFPTGRIVSTLDRQHPLATRLGDATP